MTRQEAKDYLLSLNGQGLDYDGNYGVQCFDAFNYYVQFITGQNPYSLGYGVPGAKDIFDVPSTLFTKIENNPSDPNQIPQAGDIMIYNIGTWGHVDMVLSADGNGVTTIGQNKGGNNEPMQIVTRDWKSVVGVWKLRGWLSFNGFSSNSSTPANSNQRVVGVNGVNYRERPTTSANIIEEFVSGDILDLKGFVHGENVSGNDLWFVGAYRNGYLWSGAFTNTSTAGLPDITPVTVPAPPTPPPTPTYNFVKDLACVTEVIPAGTNNFEYGNFPAKPAKAVIHDFGTKGTDTYQSVVNTIKNNGSRVVSAHFVVSGKKITQMVSLSDRAYHAGPNGNGFVGIETDPAQDPDTIASARTLLKELKAHYGYQLPLVKHSEIMTTACGDDVNLANYDLTPVEPPKPVDPPVTPPEPEKPVEPPVNGSQTILESLFDILNKILGGNMTPITGKQWKSVLINTLLAFVSAFLPIIIASGNLDKATLVAGATAGAMAALKIIQKLFTTEG